MSEHVITLEWARDTEDFAYQTYTRNHTLTFEGGSSIPASAAPQYLGDAAKVNPEEAFVAALSSCHMLTFLAIAAKKRFVMDRYVDKAVGIMEKNADGKMAVTKVALHPEITFAGDNQPDAATLDEMHHFAHDQCFIANSVTTEVTVE